MAITIRVSLRRAQRSHIMYLFNRTRTANPADLVAARAAAGKIAEKVTAILGQPVTPFETMFGAPGAISFTMTVTDMSQLGANLAILANDPSYQKFIAGYQSLWSSHAEDRLVNIIASGADIANKAYYASTTAIPMPGRLVDATTFGVSAQAYVDKGGFPSLFGSSVFGSYGELGWLVGATDMAGLDGFQSFARTDAGFMQLVDGVGGIFVPGASENRLVRRLS